MHTVIMVIEHDPIKIDYALCNYKCKKSKKCLRYINRNSHKKEIINFKPVCNANNNYQWFYKNNRKEELK